MNAFEVDWCREQFPALTGTIYDRRVVYFDGPAGSQVPHQVAEAVSHYLLEMNANHGGTFATSRESDEMLHGAQCAVADLLGASDPDSVVFGANMTSQTFALSRALARTWQPGDEILVSDLDHDANFTPWVLAARDAGATIKQISFHRDDCTFDLEDLKAKLSPRTRLVASGCASNAVGTVTPIERIVKMAHGAGALVFLDAVHYAPHLKIEVDAWGCDFLACSAYKFFGPHVGVLWGKRDLLESLPAYKVRPASDAIPDRWMSGTQNHEGIAGTHAAVEYLASIGRRSSDAETDRAAALRTAYAAIGTYEQSLANHFLRRFSEVAGVKIWGITDPQRIAERVPTFSFTHERLAPKEVATRLGDQGIFVWYGNYYALPLTEALGVEPEGMVRVGLLHYNTADEIDRLADAVASL